MKSLLFDLDGVFYVADQPVPGARETLQWVCRQGIKHCFVTNTSSRPRSALVEKLAAMGITTRPEQFLTPPVAAARWLTQNTSGPVALFVPDGCREEFNALEISREPAQTDIAAVVVGDLGQRWDFDTLNTLFRLLMREPAPELIALGMTRYWRADDGLRLDVGPFISALEYASGRCARVLGKPSPDFFGAALDMLACPPEQTLMIGDDIRGDIAGAQAAGIDAILLRTGKFQASDLDSDILPNAVLDSIAALPDWYSAQHPL